MKNTVEIKEPQRKEPVIHVRHTNDDQMRMTEHPEKNVWVINDKKFTFYDD